MLPVIAILLSTILTPLPAPAQDTSPRAEMRIRDLEDKVSQLESVSQQPRPAPRNDAAVPGAGSILFLFGAFCALWAQNTRRNPWLWFFLGLIFNIITVLVLLVKNAGDRKHRP